MSNPLVDLLLAAAHRRPGAPLLRTLDGVTWTHGDLDRISGQLASALVARGIQPGGRIAVQTPKTPWVIALHVAAARAGGVYLPLNDAYTDHEIADLLADAEPALVVRARQADGHLHTTLDELVAEAEALDSAFADVERGDDDPASMLYTSGTTGRPKGAVMSHRNLVFSVETLRDAWGFTSDDRLVHILPLYHTHGLFVAVHCVLAAGASMTLVDRFDPAIVAAQVPDATVLMGVPTHYTRLLAEPSFTAHATEGMRLFTSGSAPMPVSTHHEFLARTGHTIVERYGMTETCMLTSNPLHGERKPGTVGPPLPGVGVRVAGSGNGPGSVEVSGPNVFSGYWNRPWLRATEFTDDGWFITGDLGRFDDDGYLELVGRSKDLVITGGLNVYPKEVELVLDQLDGVDESAVIGVADPDFGEAVIAVIVAVPGAELDPDRLGGEARRQLAAFKVPKRFEFVDELPRNPMGKIEKARLRSRFGHADDRDDGGAR